MAPYENNKGGRSFNKPAAGGDRKPFNRDGGDRKPYNRDGGDRKPFNRDGGDRKPFNRDGGDRKPFNRDGGDRKPFNRDGGDRKPFNRDGGKGGARGGPRGGSKIAVQPHNRYEGVFIGRSGRGDVILTESVAPGEAVYGEKRIPVEKNGEKIEYRIWNPFRSKLGAAIVNGIAEVPIKPGMKVLYLGAASGTTVSHVADMVGPEGTVYAVEFSSRSGRDLINVAKKRTNVVPIIEDARTPQRYRMIVPMVDAIFSDVAQPDQSRIVGLNARYFLKQGGGYMISIKASSVSSVDAPEVVFAQEQEVLTQEGIKPKYKITLEPYERHHCMFCGFMQ